MTFTKELRNENDDIFQRIFHHPFVQGIGKGELPAEAVAHYIKADYEYLNAFMRIYGMAISKTAAREEIAYFIARFTSFCMMKFIRIIISVIISARAMKNCKERNCLLPPIIMSSI